MEYNWELQDWPNFTYSLTGLETMLFEFALETGEVSGMLKALPVGLQQETLLQTMIAEAIKTSEIEGEFLSRQDVMSSIKNNLGMNMPPDVVTDKKAAGIGKLMVDVRNSVMEDLSEEGLFAWHRLLLPDSLTGLKVGQWRSGREPMQVLSGSIGREKVHFEAPPSTAVPHEMSAFIQWFNGTAPDAGQEINSAPVRAAIAHLYFESIHPFEDGNGRIGRAIAEKVLSQTLGRPVMLSLSQTIEADRGSYYQALEKAQKSNEISEWIKYFVAVALDAQKKAKSLVSFILLKARFFDQYGARLNERQLKAINKMLAVGFDGYKGGMTAMKYISITKTSKATATRDLQELTEWGVLKPTGGGRNTHYDIQLEQ